MNAGGTAEEFATISTSPTGPFDLTTSGLAGTMIRLKNTSYNSSFYVFLEFNSSGQLQIGNAANLTVLHGADVQIITDALHFYFSGAHLGLANDVESDVGDATHRVRVAYVQTLSLKGAGANLKLANTDTSGTPGDATANTPMGTSAIAALASTARITNSLVSATSNIRVQLVGAAFDATATALIVTKGSGFFDVTSNAPATATTAFDWTVTNAA